MGETQTYRDRIGVPMSTETWICTGNAVRHVPNSDDGLHEYRKDCPPGAGTGPRQLLRWHHAERQPAKTSSFRMGRLRSSNTRARLSRLAIFQSQPPRRSGWVLEGAVEQVHNEATAFGHRERRLMVNPVGLYQEPVERATDEARPTGSPGAAARSRGRVRELARRGGRGQVRQTYPGAT